MAVMTPALSQTLTRATRRVRLRFALRHGATGLLAGTLIAGVLLALTRTALWEELPAEALVAPPLLGLFVGLAWGALRRLSPLDVARLTEQRLDLKERLSTALILAPDPSGSPLAARQIADAEAHAARGLDLRAALPLTLPRRGATALAAVAALFLAWFLPTLPLFQSPQERAERAAVKKEGERIVRVAKVLEREAAGRKLEQTRQAAQKLGKLGEQMRGGQVDKQKSLMKLAKLSQEMQKSQQALAAANGAKSLPRAGNDLQKALASARALPPSPGADQKLNAPNPDSGAKNPKQAAAPAPSQEAMQQVQKSLQNADMQSLAEQLQKLAQQAQQGQPGDKAGREKLAKQLSALAEALKGTSLEKTSESLKQAAEAMKNDDMAQASQQLQEAARRADQAAKKNEDAQTMQQMAQAMANAQAGTGAEGDPLADSGEGAGEKDAFGKDGKPKDGHVHTADCTKPGGT